MIAELVHLISWILVSSTTQGYCPSSYYLDESKDCHFPSINNDGSKIKECLPSKSGLWCPTTVSYCQDGKFKYCAATESTIGGSDPGKVCHFPFKYHEKSYSQCTMEGTGDNNVYFWCATAAEYAHNRWTKCKDVPEILPCHFPGIGSGIKKKCIYEHRNWRCETPHGDKRICPDTTTTEGGNDPGKLCHFPYLHEGVRYNACKIYNDNNEKYDWCSTTDNFDRDKKWTRCKEPDVFKLEGILLLLVIVASILVGACVFACIVYGISESRHLYKCLKRRKRSGQPKITNNNEATSSNRDVQLVRPLTPTAPPLDEAPPAYEDVMKNMSNRRPHSSISISNHPESHPLNTPEDEDVVVLS